MSFEEKVLKCLFLQTFFLGSICNGSKIDKITLKEVMNNLHNIINLPEDKDIDDLLSKINMN